MGYIGYIIMGVVVVLIAAAGTAALLAKSKARSISTTSEQ